MWLCALVMIHDTESGWHWNILKLKILSSPTGSADQQFVSKRVFFGRQKSPPFLGCQEWFTGGAADQRFDRAALHFSKSLLFTALRWAPDTWMKCPKKAANLLEEVRFANSVQLSDFNATIWSNFISEFRWSFAREWWFGINANCFWTCEFAKRMTPTGLND